MKVLNRYWQLSYTHVKDQTDCDIIHIHNSRDLMSQLPTIMQSILLQVGHKGCMIINKNDPSYLKWIKQNEHPLTMWFTGDDLPNVVNSSFVIPCMHDGSHFELTKIGSILTLTIMEFKQYTVSVMLTDITQWYRDRGVEPRYKLSNEDAIKQLILQEVGQLI